MPQNSTDPVASESTSDCRRLRILVVHDERAVLSILSSYLRSDGHEVTTISDARTGLLHAVGERWDLVITDRVMDGMSGDELAAEIKRHNKKMPVILITAFADRGSPTDNNAIFDLIVRKPFTRDTIRAGIAYVLRGIGPAARVLA